MANIGTVMVVMVWKRRELGGRVHDELLFDKISFPFKLCPFRVYLRLVDHRCERLNTCVAVVATDPTHT
jgi:hypothetical protein